MIELFFSSEYDHLWGALGAIFDGVASIMAIGAVWYSITSFRKSLVTSHYGELDTTYHELLKLALERTYLYHPHQIQTQQQKQEYDLYAFMVWNFLEAIYDRGKDDECLCDTWYPIIKTEGKRHYQWFCRSENLENFKDEFVTFIRAENMCNPLADASEPALAVGS